MNRRQRVLSRCPTESNFRLPGCAPVDTRFESNSFPRRFFRYLLLNPTGSRKIEL